MGAASEPGCEQTCAAVDSACENLKDEGHPSLVVTYPPFSTNNRYGARLIASIGTGYPVRVLPAVPHSRKGSAVPPAQYCRLYQHTLDAVQGSE
eukprot:3621648-Rhodomonas_salina.2